MSDQQWPRIGPAGTQMHAVEMEGLAAIFPHLHPHMRQPIEMLHGAGPVVTAQPMRLQVFRALVVAGPAGLTPGALVVDLDVPAATLASLKVQVEQIYEEAHRLDDKLDAALDYRYGPRAHQARAAQEKDTGRAVLRRPVSAPPSPQTSIAHHQLPYRSFASCR